ncbi:MAG: tRNA pseudouridine(38-40) synthase TruA [Spirochaetales bacterium]|nr:tRNA pseudouridine(38-40) synthase TruA [Spirochaetales bacterium]
MKRNIKLTVSYDGTDFNGWQVQTNGRTVQGEIEKALGIIHQEKIKLTGSGRTDSGVHAKGQIANFYTEKDNIPADKFTAALNSMLPRDIRILKAEAVSDEFHSRFDAKIRIYRYYIKAGGSCEPWHDRYCWRTRHVPDIGRLNRLAAPLSGIHDFTTFTAAGDPSKSKIRQLYTAAFTIEGAFLVFKIAGNAFLWRMVRSLVGTLMQLEEGGAGSDEMRRILTSLDRSEAGTTAPARGLFLEKVLYDERSII